MKTVLKVLVAAASFFFAPLSFAERMSFDVDEWGVPSIRTGERVLIEGNADMYLYSLYKNSALWEKMLKKLSESDDPNVDVLVAACADRILPMREKVEVGDILLKKYFGEAEGSATEDSMTKAMFERVRYLSKTNPPVLNFYLEKFYRMRHGLNYSLLFVESGCKPLSLICEVIRHTLQKKGERYEMMRSVLVRKIREIADAQNQDAAATLTAAEVRLMLGVCAWFPWAAKPIPHLGAEERERDSETLRTAGKSWSPNFLSVAPGLTSSITYLESVPVLEKLSAEGFWHACIALALCREESKEWNDAAYFSYLYLTREHCFMALGGLTAHVLYALCEQGKATEALALYEYARRMEEKGPMFRVFSVPPSLHEKVQALEQKCSPEEIERARKEGVRMAEQGYYENEEFEKRFQDSLRERAKALKAKRAAESAGTAIKNENED